MARRNQDFQTIRSEGGLLPLDLLRRVLDPRSGLPGTTAEDFGLPAGERLNEAITQSWNLLRKHWTDFRAAAANLPAGAAGTGLTNDKWSLPLLRELGFGFLPVTAGPELDGRTYPIGRFFGPVPIHLVGSGLSLDRRAAGQRGAAAANPHGLVQEFLNRSDAHLWAVASNGLRLRVLRDNQALSRQSFLDFDLETMFEGEIYSDFVLLWLVVHATRFVPRDGDRPDTCRLEQWTQEAERLGTRVLGDLRGGVERALAILGAGLTGHSKNQTLREALRSGALPPANLHEQLLRVVYRLIFLFVAEDRTLDGRSLLHPPDQSAAARIARERYADHYGPARLRRLAGRIKGSRHGDLWRQFRLLVAPLSGDPGAEAARRHLALPALGSFLWDPASTAALNDTELTNYDFLETLRHLAYTRQDKMLRPVDYHNLGAEELGGVYESLLALTPQVNAGGGHFSFAEFTGNRRKTSGSYYTPDALVQCLLDSALDPVVEAAVKDKTGAEAEQAILDLKVCDPAVGSGHFLVGAAHRLARHLARIRAHAAGESEPSPLLYQRSLRDVIGRSLYGVDVNPMAAELCRVGLWLEALEPGKPLSFLDRHIRVGNSLLGATPELIEDGLPDAAFKPIQGDDKKVCAARRKQNKTEREHGQRDLGFIAESGEEYDSLASRSRSIDRAPDNILGDVHTKEDQFRRLQESADYQHAQQIANTWCAAFVWPKRPGVVDSPTTDTVRRLREGAEALAPAEREEMEFIAVRYQFFHWHIAFPEVFVGGGFDCVLGNPPWEHTELKEKEWFADRHTGIVNARTGAERKRLIAALQHENPSLYNSYTDALRGHDCLSHLLRYTGRFPHGARGRINLYAVFAEGMRNLVNDRGRAGCVLPTGIATDDSTKMFFQDVVETGSLVSLFDFENKGIFFPGVHSSYKFCLFTAGNGAAPTSTQAEFVFFAHAVEELNDPERRFALSRDEIALLNPNTRTCPIFRSRKDAELTKAIYRRVPVLHREAIDGQPENNPWDIRFRQGLFNLTSDSHLFYTQDRVQDDDRVMWGPDIDGARLKRLYEGRFGHQFNHRFASCLGNKAMALSTSDRSNPVKMVEPRYWVTSDEVEKRLSRRDVGCRTALLGYRRVARNTDERTCISSILPWGAASYGWTLAFGPDANSLLLLCGMFNSFIFDYLLRGCLSQPSIPQSLFSQVPLLPPGLFGKRCEWNEEISVDLWLYERVLELVYTAYDLQSLAEEMGHKEPPYRWNDERRFLLRCELDAAFCRLYLPTNRLGAWYQPSQYGGEWNGETPEKLAELTLHLPTPRDAVNHIMDAFPIVRRKDQRGYGEYRTKRVILEIYDAMQTAAATGEPYRTVVDPPPSDRTCCHSRHIADPDLAALADGAWARPEGDQIGAEMAVLAAVLKASGGPSAARTVRLTALLAMEPWLLTPSLLPEDAIDWRRLVGAEARANDSSEVSSLESATHAWGSAVRQLRGSGRLLEDLSAGTWVKGSGLEAIRTTGWPDGRVSMVVQAMSRRGNEEIVRTLPQAARDWINAEAA
ncbi:MAG: N-6 DNA methylase [Spirochaetaceae bacterium]|nr:N-6 DNA methylase [Spirochaetaceae bacterium]